MHADFMVRLNQRNHILDASFDDCAFAAFIELAAIDRGPPDIEATRRRAYRLYEKALAERHHSKIGKSSRAYGV